MKLRDFPYPKASYMVSEEYTGTVTKKFSSIKLF